MAKYELTINGITKQFDTAEEMATWRYSMVAKPKRKKRINKKKPKTGSLSDFINKRK